VSDKRITDFTSLPSADPDDLLVIFDVSVDFNKQTKKITRSNLVPDGTSGTSGPGWSHNINTITSANMSKVIILMAMEHLLLQLPENI